MWMRKQRETVAVAVDAKTISCSLIRSRDQFPFELVGYRNVSLAAGTLDGTRLFNPTALQSIISAFAREHDLTEGQQLLISLGYPMAQQKMSVHALAHLDPSSCTGGACGCDWQRCYLHPDNAGNFVHYACGIPQTLRLQWQLVAQKIGMQLAVLTADQMALLTVYQAMYGSAFRQSQLAVHMAQTGNVIDNLFTIDSLARLLYVPGALRVDRYRERQQLLIACGLSFFQESR